jgi:hypothetical protein
MHNHGSMSAHVEIVVFRVADTVVDYHAWWNIVDPENFLGRIWHGDSFEQQSLYISDIIFHRETCKPR